MKTAGPETVEAFRVKASGVKAIGLEAAGVFYCGVILHLNGVLSNWAEYFYKMNGG